MGIRLKIASMTFKKTKGYKTGARWKGSRREARPARVARIRLVVGPANEIRAESRRGFLRLKGSN